MQDIEKNMYLALDQAKKGYLMKEVPVGCIIVRNNIVLAASHNLVKSKNDISCHAEILAINKAKKKMLKEDLGFVDFRDCDIYITLEPCPMCMFNILQSRFKRIYFGAYNKDFGAISSLFDMRELIKKRKTTIAVGGVLGKESEILMKCFFKELRK